MSYRSNPNVFNQYLTTFCYQRDNLSRYVKLLTHYTFYNLFRRVKVQIFKNPEGTYIMENTEIFGF